MFVVLRPGIAWRRTECTARDGYVLKDLSSQPCLPDSRGCHNDHKHTARNTMEVSDDTAPALMPKTLLMCHSFPAPTHGHVHAPSSERLDPTPTAGRTFGSVVTRLNIFSDFKPFFNKTPTGVYPGPGERGGAPHTPAECPHAPAEWTEGGG